MVRIRLRPVQEADLTPLEESELREADPWNWFTHVPTGVRRRRFAADGMLSEEAGTLAVETPDGVLAGTVSWFTVKHGPSAACQALNIGISLLPGQRGRGYGATHFALSVATDAKKVAEIASRAGWKCFACNRGPFHVIEVWVENESMVEILPPEFAAEYLAFTRPDKVAAAMAGAPSAPSRQRPA